ncbi:phage integrase N-terminal SAM-like domain-containing protein [Mesorhizobium sp. M0012]
MRGLGSHTQQDYVRHVRRFAVFLGRSPDTATAEDIRRFQLHQHESGVGSARINGAVSALPFLSLVTLKRRDLARALVIMRYQRKLPDVLSVEEAARLLEAHPASRHQVQGGTWRRLWRGACACPKSRTSRSTTSTQHACLSASNRARDAVPRDNQVESACCLDCRATKTRAASVKTIRRATSP